jgi:L-ascorbate metabolism protein UlaG (beta-lactamase superfamily)
MRRQPGKDAKRNRLQLAAALLASSFLVQCSVLGGKPEGERLERMKASKHWAGGKFRNPVDHPIIVGSYWGMLKELLFGDQQREPGRPLPVVPPAPSDFPEPPAELQLVWLGHSTLILDLEGKRFLVDPVFGSHASPVPVFAGRFQPPPLSRDSLPRIDAVIISHDHYDHLEMETMRHFAGADIPILAPLGVGAHLEEWGVRKERIVELDWWREHALGGMRIVCTPSQHFSGRGLTDRQRTLWASWTLVGRGRRVHYSGDGGYGEHFKAIGDAFGPFDLTLLENGAYDERWPYVHMFPEQAVQAHLDLKGNALVAVHWGMFSLANHDWFDPIRRIAAASRKAGVRLLAPRLGETLHPLSDSTYQAWWEPLTGP